MERLPEGAASRMLADLGYTFGFLVVVLGRQQLFTENTLTPILPLLYHRTAEVLWKVSRLWGLVLAANITATWVIAAVLAHGPGFTPERSEEHTSELQSLMRISYAVFCLKKKTMSKRSNGTQLTTT